MMCSIHNLRTCVSYNFANVSYRGTIILPYFPER